MRNANDDSKRNSKELQPKIDDTLWRAERHGKGANTWGVQKTIFVFKTIFFEVFIYENQFSRLIVQYLLIT